jgi:RNA polymerase sigma-70 factor (ECF subfamily)
MSRATVNEESEDGDLVSAAQAGDQDAFGILVHRHQKAMLNVAYRLLGNYEEACDGVQDAFVAAHRALGGFRGEARFTTWLTAITLNHARNRLASLQARRRHEAYSLDAPRAASQGELRPDPPADGPSPLDLLEARTLRHQVEACLGSLPPDFREVMILRDLQDISYLEISSILQVREGTVKSRLARAREGIRACLERARGRAS